MQELKIENNAKKIIDGFIAGLKGIYGNQLISIILYGSASSGEFSSRYSNLNLLVVLKKAGLDDLDLARALVNKPDNKILQALFMDRDYINSSLDVFPIEFLDMKENYKVLSGEDALQNINVGTRNLRFQCEQELKAKLLSLKQLYLKTDKNNSDDLTSLLVRNFTSVLHILRSVLRLKAAGSAYLKNQVLADFSKEFQIDMGSFQRILALKNRQKKLPAGEVDALLREYALVLEKITGIVDKV